jgi:hypothetical protein
MWRLETSVLQSDVLLVSRANAFVDLITELNLLRPWEFQKVRQSSRHGGQNAHKVECVAGKFFSFNL